MKPMIRISPTLKLLLWRASERHLGGLLTDLALEVLQSKSYLTEAPITNYKSTLQDGRICRSSSYLCFSYLDLLLYVPTVMTTFPFLCPFSTYL
ncbi:PAS domain-containing protein [Paenisporosarcina sp. OV554]|uniref:PAS domain-containing protein n=1 Tax=Paenisporosarcina sp. OV554 TaxID=2135694 RepID=UPI0035140DD2